MRCYICDTPLSSPVFDENHKAYPCDDCETYITEVLEDYEGDAVSIQEEGFYDIYLDNEE